MVTNECHTRACFDPDAINRGIFFAGLWSSLQGHHNDAGSQHREQDSSVSGARFKVNDRVCFRCHTVLGPHSPTMGRKWMDSIIMR